MVSITKIDPSEIPEVRNRFLMRSDENSQSYRKEQSDKNGNGDRERRFGWSKRNIPQSRSGRQIKGRGSFRYRTPSRSRSRSATPEHWKAASRKLIKFTDFEKKEVEKKAREEEIKRRMEERKKRHDAIARGDGKKAFYELSQEPATIASATLEVMSIEKQLNDPNELDYEVDEDEIRQKKDNKVEDTEKSKNDVSRKRSRSRDYYRRNNSRDRRDDYRSRRNFDRHDDRRRRHSRSRSRQRNR